MNFIKGLVPQKLKNVYHLFQAVLAILIYGSPSKNIKIIGVTGTNGKTTTVQMIARILEKSGKRVAMASTINFKLGDKEWINKTKFTTLSSFQIQKFVKDAEKANCEYLVMETSSHALDQFRVWGVRYDTAVITNVTREHLDYHKTMKEYRKAKLKLFRNVRTAIVNLNMEEPKDFLENNAQNKYGYCTELSDFKLPVSDGIQTAVAAKMNLGVDQTSFKLSLRGKLPKDWEDNLFTLHLPGEYNIENALASICVGLAEGIGLKEMRNALESIKGVPGRFERVPNDRNLKIIIDYALTPDSLKKLYKIIIGMRGNAQQFASSPRIISVFGSCGERDRGKRPIMGEIVSQCADFIILTNEDPYYEDPNQIINEIFMGIKNKKEGENIWRILDRREAIKKALQLARPGDIIVVTGKGAEETMAIGKKRIPWNDKQVIRELLLEE